MGQTTFKRMIMPLVFIILACQLTGCKQEITLEYEPTWESLSQHKTPEWFDNAKYGFMITWGVYSVPAWAPKGSYAEWYPHQMYVKGSPTYEYHIHTYGPHSEFGYKEFIPMFKAEKWDPDAWADLFVRAGARYIVPIAEHHDGFAMWDSKLTEYDAMDTGPERDIIGELGEAVRKRGLRYAPSYHRARNWFYYPHFDEFDTSDPTYAGLYGEPHESTTSSGPGEGNADPSEEFLQDWKKRWEEYRDKYKPDMLWFDGMWGLDSAFLELDQQIIADYYNLAQEWGKEVAVNNKGGEWRGGLVPDEVGDYIGNDYMALDTISTRKWSNPRGIGHSYGYNRNESLDDYATANELVDLLVDIVSKNGNLLLNIGPKADGTIPQIQKERLLEIGEWLEVNGEAIYGTDYWETYGEDSIRFTRKGRSVLYAISLNRPENTFILTSLRDLKKGDIESVALLGSDSEIKWTISEDGLIIEVPEDKPCQYAYAFKITGHIM